MFVCLFVRLAPERTFTRRKESALVSVLVVFVVVSRQVNKTREIRRQSEQTPASFKIAEAGPSG